MKQIELNLQKRLLIVECECIQEAYEKNTDHHDIELICKGSELTEEIAFQLVKENSKHGTNTSFVNYKGGKSFFWAKESFVSAIEAHGYYWGENPVKHPEDFDDLPSSLSVYVDAENKHFEAELKTFNPAKTLIFEILL